MGGAEPTFEDLVYLAAATVVAVAGAFLIWFGNPSSSPEAGPKFAVASMYMLVPTTEFEIVLEVLIAVLGGVSVSQVDIRIGVFVGFLLYFATSFIIYWLTMPV